MNEYRPGGFSMPPVVKNLLIINVLVFVAQKTFENNASFSIDHFFGLHTIQSIYFKPHQIITYMFLHGGVDHILFNMLALWMFGSMLEQVWGAKRFLTFYMLCGIGAGLLHLGVLYMEIEPQFREMIARYPAESIEEIVRNPRSGLNGVTVGASGSIFGCLAAFGYLFPNMLIYVYFLFPVKAKWFVLFYGGLELYLGIRNSAGDNVAHWAHLGGALVGIIIVLIWNKNNRRRFY